MNEVIIRRGHLEGWFSEGVTIRGEGGQPGKFFLIDEPGKVHARADADHPTGAMVCAPVELQRRWKEVRLRADRPCPCCHAAVCCNGHPR